METSVKAAEVLVTSQPDLVPHLTSSADQENAGAEAAAAACGSSPDFFDPMLEFSRRLDDIISTYGSSTGLLDKQHRSCAEAALDTTKEWTTDDITVTVETDVSLIKQSLNKLSSPEDRVEDLLRRYTELAASRRGGDRKLCVLQQTCAALQEEKQQLQAECRSGAAARSKLEALCRELQSHYNTLREETLQRCREDEEKRDEITCHFQKMLTDIQAQIEQHSSRNDKLCRENANLTDKLESLMSQCETREESLEKISRHHDLQNKLTEAKLQEANALLAAAEEKHKREKEYLLREAIDKTKKCFAMKEQELAMKKKLTLYGQKFDEFQATLAKSNEIYVHFKKEMDNMSDKMKKMEKESNLWKMRFENCNKALTDMIEERTEKGKEYDLFVLKIQRLEKLCRALQDERKVLYDKIKEVRYSNSQPPTNVNVPDITLSDPTDQPALLTPGEMQELQDQDPVLTKDMDRLRQEQARLQEFAACLMTTPENHQEDNHDIDLEEDVMASAFFHFNTKREVKEAPVPDPEPLEDVKPEASDADLLPVDQVEKVPQADVSTPTSEETSAVKPTDLNPDAVKGETPEEVKEQRRIQTDEETETQSQSQTQTQTPSGQEPTPETEPPSEPNPNTAESEVLEEPGEVQQLVSEEPSKLPEFPAAESAAASDPDDCCKKQTPKKKKKKSAKSSS